MGAICHPTEHYQREVHRKHLSIQTVLILCILIRALTLDLHMVIITDQQGIIITDIMDHLTEAGEMIFHHNTDFYLPSYVVD